VRITQKELDQINIINQETYSGSTAGEQEVADIKGVALETFVSAGRDLAIATDSLYSLFYDKSSIAQELAKMTQMP